MWTEVRRERETTIRIGDFFATIRCDLADVHGALIDLYGPCHGARGAPCLKIDALPSASNRYSIFADGHEVFPDRPVAEILPYVEWGINRGIIRSQPNFLQVHAASLAMKDQGVVLAGNSGAGKSTLAMALLSRGWRYGCDEFALIHRVSRKLMSLAKAICIKSGSFDIARSLRTSVLDRTYYVSAIDDHVSYVPPPQLQSFAPVDVGFVFFPQFKEEETARLVPLSRAETAYRLMRLTMNRAALGPDMARVASAVACSVHAFALTFDNWREACDLVEQVVTVAHSRGVHVAGHAVHANPVSAWTPSGKAVPASP